VTERAGLRRALLTRPWIGRFIAPPLAVAVYALLPDGAGALETEGRAVAAVAVLMAVLWMTEALPLAATSLLPVVLFPLAGALPIREATAPYADPIIFLFIGGFMIALAMQRWDLHKRIALVVLRRVGTHPRTLVGGFMATTALLSMWVSNTATAVMMLPVGMSVLALVLGQGRDGDVSLDEVRPASSTLEREHRNLAVCLMLGIAFAASIGSVATLIGTPPNLFFRGFMASTYGVEIGFGTWMLFGVPLAAAMLLVAWLLLTRVVYPPGDRELAGSREVIEEELAALGAMSRGERNVLVVFLVTAAAWVAREPLAGWEWLAERLPFVTRLSDAGIAIAAALALFALPVDVREGRFTLDWPTAKKLPWGVLFLFGGGLSLAAAVTTTGVDAWVGEQLAGLGALPLVALVASVAAVILLLTELTSNTATAATMLPILGGVAVALGLDPLVLVLPATVAASFAFMLPVATPPNAIVFGSGYVTIPQMVRAGVWLNLIGVVLVTAATFTLAALVFGL